jgi:aspartate/methionine/tyrosine aminotransferase
MSKFVRRPADGYSVNPLAFNFLSECSAARPEIDMTSTISISSPSQSVMDVISQIDLVREYQEPLLKETSRGNPETLREIAEFFSRNGIRCDEHNVSMSEHGILSSISKAYNMLGLESSDKVIIPTPTFGYYFKQLQDSRINFEIMPTKKENNFAIDPIELEERIDRTGARVLLLCYPNNPTGAILTRENAEAIAEVVKRRGVFVISDEVFIKNNLSGDNRHCSIASIDGMLEQSLTLTSISKMMGIPSVRTAICLGSSEVVNFFAKLGGYQESDQKIISTALKPTEENLQYLETDRQKYLSNIALIKDRVSDLNHRLRSQFPEDGEDKIFVKPFIENPEAGNVYLLDFSGLKGKMHDRSVMNTGLDVAKWLLKEASVGTVPGECYAFDEKEMLIRIALGHPQEEINKAFDNMCEAITKIQVAPRHLPNSSSKDSHEAII